MPANDSQGVDEAGRLEALRRYELLDTPSEQALDDLTTLAAQICQVPIALVSLVDEGRQWFKSKFGLKVDETSRDVSFCAHALGGTDLLIVPDATADPRFAENSLVTGEPHIRFYAGAPLITPDGHAIGTICVIDRKARSLDFHQLESLRALARQAMAHFELRLHARQALERERLLQGIFDSRPDCVKMLGQDGTLQLMNKVGLEMIQADSFERVRGQCAFPLVVPEHRQAYENLVARVFRGESATLEFEIVGLKGARKWLETSATPIRDEKGQVVSLLGVTRDVGDRKSAEDLLRKSESRYRTLFDCAPTGIIIADASNFCIDANPSMCRMLGHEREELVGLHARDILADEERPHVEPTLDQILRGEPIRREWRFRRKDGSIIEAEVVAAVLPDGNLMGMVQEISERKQAEQRLRDSEERFRGLIDASAQIVWTTSADGTVVEDSPSWRNYTGQTVEQWLCDGWLEAIHPEDRDRVDEMWKKAVPRMEVASVEYRLRHVSGEWRWTQVRVVPLKDETGRLKCWVGMNVDITDSKHASEALRQSEEIWKFAVEGAGDGVWDLHVPTREVGFSRRWKEMLGYAADELADRFETWERLVHPDDLPRAMADFQAYLDGLTETYANEHRLRCKDGSWAWILARGMAVSRDENGRPLRMVGTHTDLTERRLAEAERARLAHVVETSLNEIYLFHPETLRFEFVNSGARRNLGYSMMQLLEMTPVDLKPEISEDEFSDILRPLRRKTKSRQVFTTTHRRADGSDYPVEVHLQLIEQGGKASFLAVVLDISERLSLETQLRQSQKMEAIGTLAGGVAHDFNNLLSSIIGNTDLVREDVGEGHPAVESLDEIGKATSRAKALVQQILAFARRQSPNRKVIAPEPVVQEVGGLARATIPAGVDLQINSVGRVPNILADSAQVHQVLLNICVNAWLAIENGTGRVSIVLDAVDVDSALATRMPDLKSGRHVRISVTDDGKGMNASTLKRIFEPFFTTRPPGEGTGLGLSVVHGIMRHHEGAVSVESRVGTGSTFRLYFPAVDAEVREEPALSPKATDGRGMRIAYVDDEDSLVLLVSRTLKRRGFEVTGFTESSRLLAAISDAPDVFDVVVTDYNMPGRSGLQVIEEIRRVAPELPVILTSGHISDELREKSEQVGVKELVYKPDTVDELCAALQRLL